MTTHNNLHKSVIVAISIATVILGSTLIMYDNSNPESNYASTSPQSVDFMTDNPPVILKYTPRETELGNQYKLDVKSQTLSDSNWQTAYQSIPKNIDQSSIKTGKNIQLYDKMPELPQ